MLAHRQSAPRCLLGGAMTRIRRAPAEDKKLRALKKKYIGEKSMHSKLVKEIRDERLSDAIKKSKHLIQKRISALFKNIKDHKKLLDRKNIKMDESIETDIKMITKEMKLLKDNIEYIKGEEDQRKREMYREYKSLKENEKQMRITSTNNLNSLKVELIDKQKEMQNTYQEMQRKEDNKRRKFEEKIRMLKGIEAEEKTKMEKETEKLQTEHDELKKKVQAMQTMQAEEVNKLQAKILYWKTMEAHWKTEAAWSNVFAVNTVADQHVAQAQLHSYVTTYYWPHHKTARGAHPPDTSHGSHSSGRYSGGNSGYWRRGGDATRER